MDEDVNQENENEFAFYPMNEIQNCDYEVYVTYKGNHSFYREFEAGLKQPKDKIALGKILRCMERFSPHNLLPKTKFRHIEGDKDDRDDIYEFKNDKLRVYVALLPCDILVLLGGFKDEQNRDVTKVFRHFNDLVFSQDLIKTEDEKN